VDKLVTAEEKRLEEDKKREAHWRRWGPYLSERQWGTVREDYSPGGTAWEYFPHDHARSRAYRWGEDGLLGISDNHQRLCFALALWNGEDPIFKERLFGLTGNEGNHGEDVKEYYYYLDSTPTHSYMKGLYKYPQAAYPYQRLVEETKRRSRQDPEFELIQTGVFDQDRYFDIFVEYAKASAEDILIRISAVNRGPRPARLEILPTLWFRNTWSWDGQKNKPVLKRDPGAKNAAVISAVHPDLSRPAQAAGGGSTESALPGGLGNMRLIAELCEEILFTENETNVERIFGVKNFSPFVKDGINDYVIHNRKDAVNPRQEGTKAALRYRRTVQPGETWTLKLRLANQSKGNEGLDRLAPAAGGGLTGSALAGGLGQAFEDLFNLRQQEADEFYEKIAPPALKAEQKNIQRQAFAGLLWSKQYYNYVVKEWMDGDPASPPPPPERKMGRNREWDHLYSDDVFSMPDKWEYPWFAAWDLAFHCIPLAMIDPEFAKKQLLLLTREWYMHPNGQLPAYEWAFGDVNPPVHAWAAWRVYKIEKKMHGTADRLFLERVFQKLLLNFTWWVNRKDTEGNNIFQGGFLGLDNIGIFDRSQVLPTGGFIEQSDGTSWMAMYCLNLLTIALELAQHNPSYEDIASKFFEHFLYISEAMNRMGSGGESLWNEEDGFFYDNLHLPNGKHVPLKVRSMVGLIPLFAVETLEVPLMFKLPGFSRRFNWFLKNRPDLATEVTCNGAAGVCERRLLSVVPPDKLKRILEKMLSENEFLSLYGVRSVSQYHRDHPYTLFTNGSEHRLDYNPGESTSGLFGGNSNWRGPVWMPVNFLLIESLQKFHHYLGDEFKVECPAGSGNMMTLWEVAEEISRRVMNIFARDSKGNRPVHGGTEKFQKDPHWKDLVLFYEYFHGDSGAGVGASHQTGWTALAAKLIQQYGEYSLTRKAPLFSV